jgi:hypothetical protein
MKSKLTLQEKLRDLRDEQWSGFSWSFWNLALVKKMQLARRKSLEKRNPAFYGAGFYM